MMRAPIFAVFALSAAVMLAGCGGTSVPPDSYYRLSVAPAPQGEAKGALRGTVSIAPLDGDGLVRSRPLLYTKGADGEAVLQHNYHHWADSPTKMIQDQLAAFLKDAEVAQAVVTPELRVRSDYEVVGRVERLERIVGAGSPRVAAAIELSLIRQSDRKLLHARRYESVQLQSDDGVSASVSAMNDALKRIFDEFAEDLAKTER